MGAPCPRAPWMGSERGHPLLHPRPPPAQPAVVPEQQQCLRDLRADPPHARGDVRGASGHRARLRRSLARRRRSLLPRSCPQGTPKGRRLRQRPRKDGAPHRSPEGKEPLFVARSQSLIFSFLCWTKDEGMFFSLLSRGDLKTHGSSLICRHGSKGVKG